MSKYIRTKDGRIVYIGTNEDPGFDKGVFEIHNQAAVVYTLDPITVIKEADSIDELCDEFVLDHPLFGCKTLYHSFEKAKKGIDKRNDDAHKLQLFTIYGAIWTEKGLIYVAKMNSKGKLELI